MANSADPDQLASLEANWSGSTLFAKAGYILDQQDQGNILINYFQGIKQCHCFSMMSSLLGLCDEVIKKKKWI